MARHPKDSRIASKKIGHLLSGPFIILLVNRPVIQSINESVTHFGIKTKFSWCPPKSRQGILQHWHTAFYSTLAKVCWKWCRLCGKNSLIIAKDVWIIQINFIVIVIKFSEKKWRHYIRTAPRSSATCTLAWISQYCARACHILLAHDRLHWCVLVKKGNEVSSLINGTQFLHWLNDYKCPKDSISQ
jgi:hypothetical protein